MAWLIGTDEAGYGPKLGPLVIAVTAWEVPDDLADADLYDLLATDVVRWPADAAGDGRSRARPKADGDASLGCLTIADSKRLYQAGGSLGGLETGTLAALWNLEIYPNGWRELFAACAPFDAEQFFSEPWNADYQADVPVDIDAGVARCYGERLRGACQRSGVRLAAMRARTIVPGTFNAELSRCDGKGEVLSRATLELVRWACELAGDQTCRIVCDKHGGRNHYAPLVQQCLTDQWVRIESEGRDCSSYLWGDGNRIEFRAGGERHLPSGLASMMAKYLRELAMRAWNAYWLARQPDLRPTAGYPADAERFLHAIRPHLNDARVTLRDVWRDR